MNDLPTSNPIDDVHIPVPAGRVGLVRDLIRLISDEKHRCAAPGSWTNAREIAGLMPMHDLIDVTSRIFRAFAVAAVNPAIPDTMRDRSLVQFMDIMRLVQHQILEPRLKALCTFWADPVFHLVTLLHDVEAVCRTPEFMARIEPTVRRAIAARRVADMDAHQGGLVSNLVTLLVALAPFDAAWQTICRKGAKGYQCLFDEALDSVSPLSLSLAANRFFASHFAQFALPPDTPRCDPDGMVVGSPTSNLSTRLSRKHRQFERAAERASQVLAVDDAVEDNTEFPSSVTLPPRRSAKPVALYAPPAAPEAPYVALVGTPALISQLLGGPRQGHVTPLAIDAPPPPMESDFVAFRVPPTVRPTSKRSQAVRAFLDELGMSSTDPPKSGKSHRPEVAPARAIRMVGLGMHKLPFDVQREILRFLPPRSLRAAHCTCRRWTSLISSTRELNAACWMSFHFGKRFEWFLEDEWGERVMSLPSLPTSLDPDSATVSIPVRSFRQ